MALFQVTEASAVQDTQSPPLVYLVHTGIRDEELYMFLCKIHLFLGDGSSTLKKFLLEIVKFQLSAVLFSAYTFHLSLYLTFLV